MNFNSLIPELTVLNYKKSLDFYTKTLGFKVEYERTENKFAMLSFEGSQIMINERNGNWETGKLEYPLGRGVNFEISVKNINLLIEKLKDDNIKFFRESKENWYRKDNKEIGQKEFLIQDPDGYLLRFAQDLGERLIK